MGKGVGARGQSGIRGRGDGRWGWGGVGWGVVGVMVWESGIEEGVGGWGLERGSDTDRP